MSLMHEAYELQSEPERQGRRARTHIPRGSGEDVFGFAPFDWDQAVCVSRSGRPRAKHLPDKDGQCCLCDQRVA